MIDLVLPDFDKIKIIDDDLNSAQKCKFLAQEFVNVDVQLITDGSHNSVEQLLKRVLKDVTDTRRTAVLCDNRLFHHGGFANFYGAQFVAELYRRNVAAILLTEFAEDDIDISIRRYRRWTPVMMRRGDLNETSLPNGFQFCRRELDGMTPASRKPYRTIVQIKGCVTEAGKQLAEVIVPGWNTEQLVRFPLDLMPPDIQYQTMDSLSSQQATYVFAQVNIGARQSSEIFFDGFEFAGQPQNSPLDRLK